MSHKNIIVAIGANLTGADGRGPQASCIWAADRLAEIAGLHEVGRSRWFRSPAHPPSSQPDYVNGVVMLEGAIGPLVLLDTLQAIEAEAGRVRSVANAARTLDLDILAMDGLSIEQPRLVIPHPRLHLRAFVLRPLGDVAPNWRHPVTGLSVADMLSACPDPDSAQPLL